VAKQIEKKVKRLRTENGMKLCSNEFEFCRDEGISRHHTFRETPQQNRVVEQTNSTLLEKARCMLSNAKLPNSSWPQAVCTVVYLVNRSAIAIDCKTLNDVLSGTPADYSKLYLVALYIMMLVRKN